MNNTENDSWSFLQCVCKHSLEWDSWMLASPLIAGQGIHILPQEVAGKVPEIQGQKNYDDKGGEEAA